MSRLEAVREATLHAYRQAIANGSDEATAYEEACAVYQQAWPLISPDVARRVVAEIIGRAPRSDGL
jgi:hypothetical protein